MTSTQRVHRGRIAGLLIAALAIAGFIIAAPQAAQAYPLTGTHSAVFGCTGSAYGGAGDSQLVKLTWQTTYTGTSTVFPYNKLYTFELKKAEFHLATTTSTITKIIPMIRLGESQAEWSMAAPAGSGSAGISTPVMTGSPIADGTTKTDGVNGVDWPAYSGSTLADNTFRNYIRVQLQYNYAPHGYEYCTTPPWYLDEYDGLQPGTYSTTFNCDTETTGGAKDLLQLHYTLTNVAGNAYFFNVTDVTYSNGPGTTHGPTGGISLKVDTDGSPPSQPGNQPQAAIDSNTSNWTGPTPAGFSEADGVNGVDFPTRAISYVGGQQYSMIATFHHSAAEGGDCTSEWRLNKLFGTDGRTANREYTDAFGDCAGNGGLAKFNVQWQWDVNDQLVRPVAMTVQNTSLNGRLVFATGSAMQQGGILWGQTTNPFQITTFKGTLANRTVDPGETQTISLTDATQWVRMDGTSGNPSQPSLNGLNKNYNPLLDVKAEILVVQTGAHCGWVGPKDLMNPLSDLI